MGGTETDRGKTATQNSDRKIHVDSSAGHFRDTQLSRSEPSDLLRRQLDALVPLRQRAPDYAQRANRPATVRQTDLEQRLPGGASTHLIIAVSHDDYVLSPGGVQTLIGDEQSACNHAGWNYLHVSPEQALSLLAEPVNADAFRVGLRLDGKWLGVANFTELMGAVSGCRQQGAEIHFICHHLMGYAPELVLDLIRASGTLRAICWVHDFFTLCPSYGLMRNDIAFCGAPDPLSPACTICCYGEERVSHMKRMKSFFEIADPTVLFPSEAALNFWQRKSSLCHAHYEVMPHARLVMASYPVHAETNGKPMPIRVAHLGVGVPHKGWHIFRELARQFEGDGRYTFLNLGSWVPSDLPKYIRHVPVNVTPTDRYAMVEAVAEARVDVAVIWSLCLETFCYCMHEALAGGAFAITRSGAGNAGPAIERNAPSQGCVLTDEQELFHLFKHGGLKIMLDASHRRRGALIPGGGAVTWLLNDSTNAAVASEPTPAPLFTDG